jgi:hypothetical protein
MGKKNNNGFTISRMFCTECGKEGVMVPRQVGKQREAGHLKKMFCLECQKTTNHAEIRPFGAYRLEDFQEEFRLGRFVNGEKVPVAELLSCSKTDCEYNRSGKCWNSKGDYSCGHRILKENPNDETKNLLNRGW